MKKPRPKKEWEPKPGARQRPLKTWRELFPKTKEPENLEEVEVVKE